MTAPDDRAAYVAGLRELAAFIESTPDLPLPGITTASVHPDGDDAQARAEVDRAAKVLGTTPVFRVGGEHYVASRRFGPVEYSVVAITAEHMRRYNAHMKGWRPASPPSAGRESGGQDAPSTRSLVEGAGAPPCPGPVGQGGAPNPETRKDTP